MEAYESDEIVIDLRDLIAHLLNKLWIILVVTFLAASISYSYSRFIITPQYTSTTSLYILGKTQSFSELSLSDLQIGSQLTSDYIILIQSRPVMEKVIENLDLDLTYSQLKERMNISNPNGTRILEISFKYPDAYMAKVIVDEITKVSCIRISEIMDLEQPNVFENGYIPEQPSSPNILKNTVIGAFLGFVLCVGVLVVLYILDDTINTEEDIERYLGLSTLGSIPLVENQRENSQKSGVKRKMKDRMKTL